MGVDRIMRLKLLIKMLYIITIRLLIKNKKLRTYFVALKKSYLRGNCTPNQKKKKKKNSMFCALSQNYQHLFEK